MEHAEIALFLRREMPPTGHKRLPQRPGIGPCGKGPVDGGVVDGGCSIGVWRDGEPLPLHPRVEHPQDQVNKPMIAQLTLWATLGQREVRQEKCVELWFGELDRDRRRCRLLRG